MRFMLLLKGDPLAETLESAPPSPDSVAAMRELVEAMGSAEEAFPSLGED